MLDVLFSLFLGRKKLINYSLLFQIMIRNLFFYFVDLFEEFEIVVLEEYMSVLGSFGIEVKKCSIWQFVLLG